MRGKAISSGETKIILNVFNHFKTENSSLIKIVQAPGVQVPPEEGINVI